MSKDKTNGDLSQKIWELRYAHNNEDSWDSTAARIANFVASAELQEDQEKWATQFYCEILEKKFIPGGRILSNAGRPKGQMLNCFVLPLEDSRESIGQMLKEYLMITGTGGGVGISFSKLRPKNSPILTNGGTSSGPVSFMDCVDQVASTVKVGGQRRAATMLSISVKHPDVEDFIHHKLDLAKLTNANVSIEADYSFFNAVKKNKPWDLVWGNKVYKTIDAKKIWDVLVENALKSGEPGVLNLGLMKQMSNSYYFNDILTVNPCFTAETRVWTDSGHKTFKELVNSGCKQIKVLTQTTEGKLVYRWMKNPRITQKNASLVKVTFNNGASVRCTPNHKFYLKNGSFKEAKDLISGDRVESVYRRKANQKGYLRLSNGTHKPLEHHVAFEYIPNGYHVHHINGNKSDNRVKNLKLMDGSEHNSMHMQGDQNPMRRFPDKNWLIKQNHSGKNNGRYREDISNSDIKELYEEGYSLKEISSLFKCSKYLVAQRLGYQRPDNHQVTNVEFLGEKEDVYCGTVEETGKFFISLGDDDGVLVSNCGEQPLPAYGCCCLGSINLDKFVYENGSFNFVAYEKSIKTAIRFLDNVLTVNTYPLEAIALNSAKERRIGLGVMGLHYAMVKMGIKYSSHEALEFTELVYSTLRDASYTASTELAKEKGVFPAFDADKYLRSGFIRTLNTKLRKEIAKHGMRNVCVNTQAPTGTTSMVAGVSSGIEPIFAPLYERRFYGKDGNLEMEIVKDPMLDQLKGKEDVAEGAYDISVQQHFEIQEVAQKYIDSAISKTINLPADYEKGNLSDMWLKYADSLKGTTIYRSGSRGAEPLTPIKVTKEALQAADKSDSVEAQCKTGVCEL